jgi:G2/mitotic-specific cyclin-B, other
MLQNVRNIGRRYMADPQPDASKPDAKGPGAATKRRALGDITNAFTSDESKENNAAKKPIFAPFTSSSQSSSTEMNYSDSGYNSARAPYRDYMERESDDIDARDAGNPLLATCYVNEMYQHYGRLEREFAVNATYMTNQQFVNERMRTILIDWLVRYSSILFCPSCPCPPSHHYV